MLKPLGDRVLVKEVKAVEETKSGLLIPEVAKEKPQEGEVVAVGDKTTDVVIGSRILYGKYSGTSIKLDGNEYIIMHQADILGLISEEN